MTQWFDKTDKMKDIKSELGGKHTPDSVREDARREYRKRRKEEGASESTVKRELFDLEW